MGYILHHVIVVSSWDNDLLAKARDTAVEMFEGVAYVSTIVPHRRVNGGGSILVAPDGSKEGWDHSHDGDTARRKFTKWLDGQRHDDGSSSLCWAEIALGSDDDNDTHIVRHRGDP